MSQPAATQGTEEGTYWGVFYEPPLSRVVWQCAHNHRSETQAEQCANREWNRRFWATPHIIEEHPGGETE